MRIETVRIVNLRAFADETIKLDDYTTLVGPNGSGKSTLLCALNIFFREVDSSPLNLVQLDAEDFHNRETDKPIEVTVTFHRLTEMESAEFADYVRGGKLIVTARAVFDQDRQTAPVVQYGSRLAMEDFAPYFEADKSGASATALKAIFADIRLKHPDLDGSSTVKDRMVSALRTYEGANPELCTVIPSEDQFYGVGQVGKLRRFVQWVYIPAVKDASGEQSEVRNTAFGKLVERTIRAKINFSDEIDAIREEAREKYIALIESKKEVLDEVSGQLQQRLSEWSIPDATARLDWHQDPKGAVRVDAPMTKLIAGDGQFEGNIARFGHGLQRSYLIALLHGLASEDDSAQPTLILGCEEPELYQHPPQARHLASVLESLSDKNSQVIITTHSPLFVDGKGFESVRLIRRDRETKNAVAASMALSDLSERLSAASGDPPLLAEGTLAKLNQAMQLTLSDMFFTTKLVIVEGLEDEAYIIAWLRLTDRWDAFRKGGCFILPAGGKSEIARPLAIAVGLGIPAMIVFDCDGDKITHSDANTAASREAKHKKDNETLMRLCGCAVEPFPQDTMWHVNMVAWPHDMGAALKASVGADLWHSLGSAASAALGNAPDLQKNTMHITERLAGAHDKGVAIEPLDALCQAIVDFAAA